MTHHLPTPALDSAQFEAMARENGITWWSARALAGTLGYDSFNTFDQVINKAIGVCLSLKIPVIDNFAQTTCMQGAREVSDYKLSRFACYLVAMNGDVRKPEVASAQAYFAALADAFQQYVAEAENVERVKIRADIGHHERGVASAASKVGVSDYARFQNAGYLGLYNLPIWKVRELKRVPTDRSPLDFMGKTELAANLFRITQTEEALRRGGVHGQRHAEQVAQDAGRQVRDTMKRISGTRPEELPPAEDIQNVRKALKGSEREFKKIDAKPKRPKKRR